MNISMETMAKSQSASQVTTENISLARTFYWSVRRELWENRSVYLAPLAAGAVCLVGFVIALRQLPAQVRQASLLSPMEQHAAIERPFLLAALLLMLAELIVAAIYSLDALYGERRDRSILFWKSLPVSDLMTVLVKASIPILVIPVVTFAATVVVQFVMLLLGSAVFAASGMDAANLWAHVPFFKTSAINFYHLVVFHGLWYAPFYGWMLMVSAWAKRTPVLWAVLPPVSIALIEKIAFNTSYFTTILQHRFMGYPTSADGTGGMSMNMLGPEHPVHFLLSPGMWIGLAITACFLVIAARMRRSQDVP